jgi:hypothetical protein
MSHGNILLLNNMMALMFYFYRTNNLLMHINFTDLVLVAMATTGVELSTALSIYQGIEDTQN